MITEGTAHFRKSWSMKSEGPFFGHGLVSLQHIYWSCSVILGVRGEGAKVISQEQCSKQAL